MTRGRIFVRRRVLQVALTALMVLCALALLTGCGGSSEARPSGGSASEGQPAAQSSDQGNGTTSGPPYTEPSSVVTATFDEAASQHTANAAIDTSTCSQGYVGASATASSRLKLLITKGDQSYNYDMSTEGAPLIAPLNMGDGTYSFRIMQNTSGSNYVEVASTTADVQLESEFAPYLHPSVFCDFTAESACVKKAFELAKDATNEGDVVRSIYDWMTHTITYDTAKAEQLSNTTGYVPDPDDTLAAQTGICFDYASLAAAMFRSLGIPCQIVTGYVSPNDVYHAWNMVYIDGEWVSAEITVGPDEWTRIDLTFASAQGGNAGYIGDGTTYNTRYTY